MQVNDILETSDVKEISQKTNISKENVERLIDEDFSSLIKAKALGFISILERDYQVDLNMLREKALAYYMEHGNDEDRIVFTVPIEDKKAESAAVSSEWTLVLVLGLLAYASWYFISKYDEEIFSTVTSFIEDKKEGSVQKNIVLDSDEVKDSTP